MQKVLSKIKSVNKTIYIRNVYYAIIKVSIKKEIYLIIMFVLSKLNIFRLERVIQCVWKALKKKKQIETVKRS